MDQRKFSTIVTGPKFLLRLEGFALLLVACLLFRETGSSWGKWFLLILAPDLSMIGYLLGPKAGACVYNLAHTYAAPCLLWLIAECGHWPSLLPLVLIWLAHIGFDRLLGYGLKYETGFKDTHLSRG